MNTERIKELIKRTGFVPSDLAYGRDKMLERFAELIVKECLGDFKDRIARRYQGSARDRDVAYGMEILYSNIQDKFWVNE